MRLKNGGGTWYFYFLLVFFSSNYFNKNRFCAINPMTSFVFLHPPFLSLSLLSLSLSPYIKEKENLLYLCKCAHSCCFFFSFSNSVCTYNKHTHSLTFMRIASSPCPCVFHHCPPFYFHSALTTYTVDGMYRLVDRC